MEINPIDIKQMGLGKIGTTKTESSTKNAAEAFSEMLNDSI